MPKRTINKKKRIWLAKEEEIFLNVWENRIQQLRGVRKNRPVLEEMVLELQEYNCKVSPIEIKNKIHNLTTRHAKERSIMKLTKTPPTWHLYSKVGKILGSWTNNGTKLQTGVSGYDNDISKSSTIDPESSSEEIVICRTCLSECRNYKSLYNYGLIEGEKTTLATLLTFCTNLQLSKQDSPNLPSNICTKCIGELTRSYFFKKKALDADNLLKSEFNDSNIITGELQGQCEIKIEKATDLNDTIDIKSEFSYDDEQFQNDHQKADDLIEYILQDELEKDDIIIDETDNIAVKIEGQDTNNLSQLNFEKNLKFNSNTESKNCVGDHLEQVHDDYAIICKVCGKQFRDRKFFTRHMQLHSHNTHYNCKVCDESFKIINAYKEHKSTHKANICKVCGKSFQQLFDLNIHMKIHRGETGTYNCEICGEKGMRKWDYKMHMLIHTGEKRSRAKHYACDICGKSFYNYKKMFSHREIHGGFRKFKCIKCYQRFPNAEKLKRHMRIHKESLLCHICSQTFTRETSLHIHLRYHGEAIKKEPILA